MKDSTEISSLVRREIPGITQTELVDRIQEFLVVPYPVEREWDYGAPGEKLTCWTVLEHAPSKHWHSVLCRMLRPVISVGHGVSIWPAHEYR
jgi:hypothetical protein